MIIVKKAEHEKQSNLSMTNISKLYKTNMPLAW